MSAPDRRVERVIFQATHRRAYPWLKLREGARWPVGDDGRDLCRRLNNVGRACQAFVTITSGRRTPAEQWAAYMDYLAGGILAAPCCSKHFIHSWPSCLRQCASNHCRSRAADCTIAAPTGEVNLGEWSRARKALIGHGLCLPVGSGETWHVEIGDTWNS